MSIGDLLPTLKLPVSQLEDLVISLWHDVCWDCWASFLASTSWDPSIYTSRTDDKTPLCPPHEGRFESGYLDWIGCFSGVYGSSLARHCVIVTIRADSGPITRIEPGNPHKKDGSCDEKAKQQRTNIVQTKGTPSIDEYVSMLKLRTE